MAKTKKRRQRITKKFLLTASPKELKKLFPDENAGRRLLYRRYGAGGNRLPEEFVRLFDIIDGKIK